MSARTLDFGGSTLGSYHLGRMAIRRQANHSDVAIRIPRPDGWDFEPTELTGPMTPAVSGGFRQPNHDQTDGFQACTPESSFITTKLTAIPPPSEKTAFCGSPNTQRQPEGAGAFPTFNPPPIHGWQRRSQAPSVMESGDVTGTNSTWGSA